MIGPSSCDCSELPRAVGDGPRVGAGAGRRAEALAGVRLAAPAGLGLVPLGVAFGLLVVQAGLPGWYAPVLSAVVFAGSVELLLVALVSAATPLASIAVTVLLVNARHVFYALGFPLHVVRTPLARLYAMGALIDEAYAVVSARPDGWTGPRLLAMQATLQVLWVVGGVLGVLAGGLLPGPVEGVEFALVALFLVLALDAARSRRSVPVVALGLACAVVGVLVVPRAALLTAFTLLTGALVAAHLLLERREEPA